MELSIQSAAGERRVPLTGTLVLGSAGELALADPLVSPQHLRLEVRGERVLATDLDSVTGTLLGGRPLIPGQATEVGQAELVVGQHRLRVVPEAPTGPTLREEYESLGELGAGAAGTVFAARHRASGQMVAIKVLHATGMEAPLARERFLREGQVLRRLQSPHVVRVLDVRIEQKSPCFVMELVEGETLHARLQPGPLPPAGVLRLLDHLARGLMAVHAAGVIHRDVKPGNILLTRDGLAKLTDFGLAKDRAAIEQLTRTRQGMGTLAYLAPEQAHDAKRVDERADLYALGSTLYHALSGRPPFVSRGNQLLIDLYETDPDPVAAHAPGCPPGLARIVDWLIQKDPDDRPPSAEFLLAQLERLG